MHEKLYVMSEGSLSLASSCLVALFFKEVKEQVSVQQELAVTDHNVLKFKDTLVCILPTST